jgi:hypothetical protein
LYWCLLLLLLLVVVVVAVVIIVVVGVVVVVVVLSCLKLIEQEEASTYHTALLQFLPLPTIEKFPQTYKVPMRYRESSLLLKHDVMNTASTFQPNAHDILNTCFIKSLLHVSLCYIHQAQGEHHITCSNASAF